MLFAAKRGFIFHLLVASTASMDTLKASATRCLGVAPVHVNLCPRTVGATGRTDILGGRGDGQRIARQSWTIVEHVFKRLRMRIA